MAKFKYKFKTIKEIKQRFEKKVQKELALIDLDIKNRQNEILELRVQLKINKRKKIASSSKKIKELLFFEKYESFLLEQIQLIENYIYEKEIEREEKLEELQKKSKETKTFEKLEERHLLEFVKIQDKIDQKAMDEVAVQKFMKE